MINLLFSISIGLSDNFTDSYRMDAGILFPYASELAHTKKMVQEIDYLLQNLPPELHSSPATPSLPTATKAKVDGTATDLSDLSTSSITPTVTIHKTLLYASNNKKVAASKPMEKEFLDLIKSIEMNEEISEININKYEYPNIQLTDQHIDLLIDALKRNTKVTHLSLTDCKLDDMSAIKIATLLEHNSTLIDLYIDMNKITNVGAEILHTALTNNPISKLEKLVLTHNACDPSYNIFRSTTSPANKTPKI